jgi:PTS system N-acetylglucosamine-specific IIC component
VRPSPRDLQVVVGPIADEIAREMRAALAGATPAPVRAAATPAASQSVGASASAVSSAAMLAALGGAANLDRIEAAANRLLVRLVDFGRLDAAVLRSLGVRAIARTGSETVQLVLGDDASALGAQLSKSLP